MDSQLLPWSTCSPSLSTALIFRSLPPKHSRAPRTSQRRKRQQRQRPRLLLRSEWSCGLNCLGQLLFCRPKILKRIRGWWQPMHRTHAASSLDFPNLHGNVCHYLGSLWRFGICSEEQNRLFCSSLDCQAPKSTWHERQIDIKSLLCFPMCSTFMGPTSELARVSQHPLVPASSAAASQRRWQPKPKACPEQEARSAHVTLGKPVCQCFRGSCSKTQVLSLEKMSLLRPRTVRYESLPYSECANMALCNMAESRTS